MPTEKRQRQKAGRQARLEAEQRIQKRKRSTRRIITVAIVALVVFGLSYLIFKPGKKSTTATTSTASTVVGGSGDTNPAAVTTSADCPSNFKATLNKPKWKSPPPLTIDTSKTYTATITTDVGPFTVQLDPKTAQKTVNNFVFLANHHFYDCTIFHRVVQGFIDQTGDPTGTGTGGPGYLFADELPKKATPQYPLGAVVMANHGVANTNGSQIFIVAGPEGESLPPSYSLFGQVTSGMNLVDTINAGGSASTSQTGTPVTLHRIQSVTITES